MLISLPQNVMSGAINSLTETDPLRLNLELNKTIFRQLLQRKSKSMKTLCLKLNRRFVNTTYCVELTPPKKV